MRCHGGTYLRESQTEPGNALLLILQQTIGVGNGAFAVPVQCFGNLLALVAMVERLDGLFHRDRDEQADRDDAYVREKIPPRVYRVIWYVNFHCPQRPQLEIHAEYNGGVPEAPPRC